ncbi:1-deoxy-D-xylulose-5-phosphate reductoisomerase [Brevundimonas sp. 2R-24]|uniref:1-deoxy-D-xylulose 5-phosphate reductoisomerase n=1 Tax=Peiella sedimenti TaxID=3061083 RepID=A0ABT8SMZ7_9CAUL|nr:1-deoxy-D-xylulose-5-phosphate reductoisomerase [Caulobacteraceae bacterium XZ-24]
MRLPERISILGSTGSIGCSTLDLLEKAGFGGAIEVLAAGRNVDRLIEQARRWRPALAVTADEGTLPRLREGLAGTGVEAAAGEAALVEAALRPVDWVMSAIVGAAGLPPTWAAAGTGAVIALANKESLVCCGPALMHRAEEHGGRVLPVDSEHSAILQVFEVRNAAQVACVTLTASGGPFRDWSAARIARATPQEAVAHPNWSMGAKISVDSATLMNKGLETIEAAYLFGLRPDQLDVVIHPQSVIHSLVRYADGSSLAQLGPPDMRTPIAVALAWPDRTAWPAPALDLTTCGPLTFEAPDLTRFPALRLAREALAAGGEAPAVLNGANEAAVRAFLDRRIGFSDIAAVVEEVLEGMGHGQSHQGAGNGVLEGVMAADRRARRGAQDVIERRANAA